METKLTILHPTNTLVKVPLTNPEMLHYTVITISYHYMAS